MTEKNMCGTRKKFVWKNLGGRKYELSTPEKCLECDAAQLKHCTAQSWEMEQGKDPKVLRTMNILVNQNPSADKKVEKIEQKATKALEEIREEVEEAEVDIAEEALKTG